MNGSYLGSDFNQEEIEKELNSVGGIYEIYEYDELISRNRIISNGKAIGWFQGRMELVLEH